MKAFLEMVVGDYDIVLLVELPMAHMPIYTEQIIYQLRLKGIIPIIAHPERNRCIIEDPNVLHNLIVKGALAQLNLPSLTGLYGERVKNTAEILVKHHMIHFVGTDAHSSGGSASRIREAVEVLSGLIDKDRLDKILTVNAEAVLNDGFIDIEEPSIYMPKGKIKAFFESLAGLL